MNFNSEFLRDPHIMEVIIRNPSAITTLLRLWDWASVHAKDFNYFGQSGKKVGIIPYSDLAAISARLLPDPRSAGTARPAGLSCSSVLSTHSDVTVHELQTLEDWLLILAHKHEGETVFLIDWRRWVVPPSSGGVVFRPPSQATKKDRLEAQIEELFNSWRGYFPGHKINSKEFHRITYASVRERLSEGWELKDLLLAIKGYYGSPYYRSLNQTNPIIPFRTSERTGHCIDVARHPDKHKPSTGQMVGHSKGSESGSHKGDANEF
jgi:hypothetical protein